MPVACEDALRIQRRGATLRGGLVVVGDDLRLVAAGPAGGDLGREGLGQLSAEPVFGVFLDASALHGVPRPSGLQHVQGSGRKSIEEILELRSC